MTTTTIDREPLLRKLHEGDTDDEELRRCLERMRRFFFRPWAALDELYLSPGADPSKLERWREAPPHAPRAGRPPTTTGPSGCWSSGSASHLASRRNTDTTPGGRPRPLPNGANMPTERRPVGGWSVTSRRLTVQEAAEVLGTSVDAVRMRARRGSLEAEKEPDGRVYVWVDGDSSETRPGLDVEPDALISAKDETIEELRDRARYLERQLDQEREARTEERRRHDTLLAQLMQRIPELEAPRGQRDGREAFVEHPDGAEEAPAGNGGPQTDSERPWWRRWFGG